MAHRLVRAGFDVSVIDVNAVAVNELVGVGARKAESSEELGASCDLVLIAVVNESQVRQVLGEPGHAGLLSHPRKGLVVLIHSTIHPDACRELADRAKVVDVSVLDAPMTGNGDAAAAGTLSIMVGGDGDALIRARSAVDAYAARVVHLGSVGVGQIAKIANNVAIAVTLRGVREALDLAAAHGITSDDMLPVLTSGGADSWVARSWRAIGASADDYPGGARGLGNLTHKDVSLALTLAREAGISIPSAAVAAQLLDDAYLAAQKDHQNTQGSTNDG